MSGYQINALKQINNGLAPDDGTGDTLRTGADIINANFDVTKTVVNSQAAVDAITVEGNGLVVDTGSGATLLGGSQTLNANSAALAQAVNNLAASQAAGTISYLTLAAMNADLTPANGVVAQVTNDPTLDNNGWYRKSGASGAGSWAATVNPVSNALTKALGNGSGFQQAGAGSVLRTFQDKTRERVSVKDFGAKGDGVADDAAAVQKAHDALPAGGGDLVFPNGTYKLDEPVVLSKSGLTLSCLGAVFTGASNAGKALFQITPPSLLASGRYTGVDYPSAWKNESTPLPYEGDYNTMMHEEVAANRISKVRFIGATLDPACPREFVIAHSVDGLEFNSCDLQPSSRSALRLWHCQDVSIHGGVLGGGGTYVAFFYKCRSVIVNSNKRIQYAANRALSFKGVFHGTNSIFGANSAAVQDIGVSVKDNKFNFTGTTTGTDAIAFDTSDAPLDDASGATGGATLGFTKQAWLGNGGHVDILGNQFDSDVETTAVTTLCYVENISFVGNRGRNVNVNFIGASTVTCSTNQFDFSAPVASPVNFQYDSYFALDCRNVVCVGNIFRNHIGKAGSPATISCQAVGSIVSGNSFDSPGDGSSQAIALATHSNFCKVYGNSLYLGASSVATTCVYTSPGANANGEVFLNSVINLVSGVSVSDGLTVKGAAGGQSVIAQSNGSLGSLSVTNSTGTLKAQLYYNETTDVANLRTFGIDRIQWDSTGAMDIRGQTTESTVGAAGGASALPATPSGYLKIKIGGTFRKIPYYAV
jgi:hypothetical protein